MMYKGIVPNVIPGINPVFIAKGAIENNNKDVLRWILNNPFFKDRTTYIISNAIQSNDVNMIDAGYNNYYMIAYMSLMYDNISVYNNMLERRVIQDVR